MPLQIPARPWGSVSMDLITFLPETGSGHYTMRYTGLCGHIELTHFVATKTELTAVDCAALFSHHVIS